MSLDSAPTAINNRAGHVGEWSEVGCHEIWDFCFLFLKFIFRVSTYLKDRCDFHLVRNLKLFFFCFLDFSFLFRFYDTPCSMNIVSFSCLFLASCEHPQLSRRVLKIYTVKRYVQTSYFWGIRGYLSWTYVQNLHRYQIEVGLEYYRRFLIIRSSPRVLLTFMLT